MGLFSRNAATEARDAYRAANTEQQQHARTTSSHDENDPTYLELNARTNQTRRAYKAAKKSS